MTTERTHSYHAEANVLSGNIIQPLRAEIKPQAYVNLAKEGGYLSQRVEHFRLAEVISFRSAYTQVAGNPSDKPDSGWVTLATSVVEGLNVIDVVTADRVVAQISAEHPLQGYVPRVTFLGTRFENLKIAGVEITPELDLDFCGPKPGGDKLYLEETGFRAKVERQQKSMPSAPDTLRRKDGGKMPDPAALRKEWDAYTKEGGKRPSTAVDCSIVTSLGNTGPWKSFGNALEVPEFGRIFFGELRVECDTFNFSMIRLDMGCVIAGTAMTATAKINGSTRP